MPGEREMALGFGFPVAADANNDKWMMRLDYDFSLVVMKITYQHAFALFLPLCI